MNEFEKLGIIDPILRVIEEEGFKEPSEIQKRTIPLVLQGKDVLGGSATGTGKTLAFGAGIIKNTEKGKGIQSLVLTPTRELAEQVAKAIKKFSKYKPLKITTVYGGVSIDPQIHDLQTADIVVGTPGRMLDHLQRRTINLKGVKILVLDEADIMFDMGFIDDVEKIIGQCSKDRQTMLFSATITGYVDHVIKRHLHDPEKIYANSYVDPKMLRQIYYDVPMNLKFSLLTHLLKNEKSHLVMVFCNSRANVDFVAKNLKLNGIKAMAIHGGFAQGKRTRTMDQFRSQDVRVLVCTDVAARGLDIPDISHVYNYDVPKDSKQYIHRIGRTARAGKQGKAVIILGENDHDNFSRVLREFDIKVEKQARPKVERVMVQRSERDGRSPRSGFRSGDRRGPRRDSRGPRRDSRGPRRDGPRRDSRGPRRASSGPRRDGPRGDSRGPRRDSRGPKRDSSGPRRDGRGPKRPAYRGPKRNQ
jgi:superfamily II DNA/RNA helicase